MSVRPIAASAATLLVAASTLLAGCGQKGALYLPEASGEVITRPIQTPEAAPAPPNGEPAPTEQKKPAASPDNPPATH